LYSLLVCVGLAGAVLTGADLHSTEWERNARLLEKWKADPEHYTRLLRDLKAFAALPRARQQQLRHLDRELHKGEPMAQRHLWSVLERYTLWFERLPEDDQKTLEATSDRAERLRLIRKIKERQWIERLPEKDRLDLAGLKPEKQAEKIKELHQEERKRRQGAKPPANPRPAKDKTLLDNK